MDNPRLLLWIGLALLVWMNIIQWDRDHGAPAQVAASTVQAPAGSAAAPAAPGSLPSLPSATANRNADGRDADRCPAPPRRTPPPWPVRRRSASSPT